MASRYPSFKLVTEPNDSTSTVLFDLNDKAPSGGAAPREVLAEEFSLGAPTLEGDPDAIDPLYGPREISLKLEIKGNKAQATALMSSLARVLLTGYTGGFIPGLWLRVQVTAATTPVWFRLLRPSPGDLEWDNVYTEAGATLTDRWYLDLTLPAEAFGYGALETIAAQTLNNDPTAGTNPCRIDLGTIKGDAPAPLRIESTSNQSYSATGYAGLVHLHAGGTTALPVAIGIGTADGLTVGADVSAASANAAAVEGSERALTFATTLTMATRLSGNTPAVTKGGTYKALLRVDLGVPAAGTKTSFQLRVDGVAGPVKQVSSKTFALTGYTWVDLGDFTFPARIPQLRPADLPDASVPFELSASRSVAASVALDHLLLIPVRAADTAEARALALPLVGAATWSTIDGDTEENWLRLDASGPLVQDSASAVGVYPRAIPGKVNTLWLFPQIDGAHGNIKTNTLSVVGYYYPRYLNVPGA